MLCQAPHTGSNPGEVSLLWQSLATQGECWENAEGEKEAGKRCWAV